MRRLPLGPTLFTFVAVAVMVALGLWQLQRREWKEGLVARLEAAPTLPPASPTEFLRAMQGIGDLTYRRAELVCRPGTVKPYDLRPGASRSGDPGFLVVVACAGTRPDIVAGIGWTDRPDVMRRAVTVDAVLTGMIIQDPYRPLSAGRPKFLLIADQAVPPFAPARQPSPADLPNNHLSYAFQWFGFSVTLLVIYGLWLRKWRQSPVAGDTHRA